jgi:hypothetical protein
MTELATIWPNRLLCNDCSEQSHYVKSKVYVDELHNY